MKVFDPLVLVEPSTQRGTRQRNRIDSVTGNCGLYPPRLFRRIGTMAANGDHPLPRHKQTTPTPSRPDRANEPTTGCGWAIDKPSGGMLHPAKTTPASIASGPAQAPSQARLDNRKRMVVAKPSSRRIAKALLMSSHCHHLSRREPMTARAGPSGR
jgi:hypothetical protein